MLFNVLLFCVILSLNTLVAENSCEDNSCSNEGTSLNDKDGKKNSHTIIDAKALKNLLDTQKITLIDARGSHADHRRIKGAMEKSVSVDTSEEDIIKMFPNKKQVIVCYCWGGKCDLGARLAKRLVEMGYDNVSDYPGGISEWAKEYPDFIIYIEK